MEFEEIDRIVKQHGEDGIKFLFIFKILKNNVLRELKKKNARVSDLRINEICAKATNNMLVKGQEIPSKVAIKKAIEKIASEL